MNDKMREEFTKLAQREYRNDDKFTARDFDIAFRGFQLARASQPSAAPLKELPFGCLLAIDDGHDWLTTADRVAALRAAITADRKLNGRG